MANPVLMRVAPARPRLLRWGKRLGMTTERVLTIGAAVVSALVATWSLVASGYSSSYSEQSDVQKRLGRIEAQTEYIQQELTEIKNELRDSRQRP